MLYISGTDGTNYNVVDTKKGQNRVCSLVQLKEFTSQGIRIGGIKVLADGTIVVLCKSNNFLVDFAQSITRTLAKLALLTSQNDAQPQIKKVEQLAKDFGVLDTGDSLKIDLKGQTVLLPYQDMIIKYDKSGNYEIVNHVNMLNVIDPNVVNYSHLGFDAFNYMYLEVGGKKYTMTELTNLLSQVDRNFRSDQVTYIGITPSNRMFKFKLCYGDIYSVRYDVISKVKSEAAKIKNLKALQSYEFKQYVMRVAHDSSLDPNGLGIVKCTYKTYSGASVAFMHQKYSTLQDVFISQYER